MPRSTNFRLYSIFLILLGTLAPEVKGQHILWANTNNMDRRTDYTKVIGQNKNGVFVLKHKNSTFRKYFILEQFDRKMNLVKSKTFKMPGGELEKIIVGENEVIYFSKIYGKGFSYKLQMQRIDSTMNESDPVVIIQSVEIDHENVEFNIEYNHKKDKYLVWYFLDMTDSTSLRFHLCDKKGVKQSGKTTFKCQFSELFVGDDIIDDNGNLFLIYTRSEKYRSKNPKDFFHYFYGLNIATGKTFNVLINDDETYVNSYKINYNYENNTLSAFGTYGVNEEDDNAGFFYIMANPNSMSSQPIVFQEFDRKIVTSIIGFKNEQRGDNLSKFKIKKIIPKADGGNILIAERTYITTQSEVFYVNGIQQSTYARIYNSDEVLVFNLDSIGSIIWSDIIYKNQSTTNDGGYYNGIIVMVTDDQFNVIYNDKLNANADIIQVTYNSEGRQSKKILLNNDQYYALIIPAESNQVTANSIVIPINQNRDFTYIKLLY